MADQQTESGRMLDRLRNVDPYEFEHFVAELWGRQGWDTEVIQASGDAGVDIVAHRSESGIDQHIVIQAKRYAEDNPVGGPEVQQYHSLREQENADMTVVVTTSDFTDPARDRADDLKVKLVSGGELVDLIREYNAYDLFEEYAPTIDATELDPAARDGDVVVDVQGEAMDPAGATSRKEVDLPAFIEDDENRRNISGGAGIVGVILILNPMGMTLPIEALGMLIVIAAAAVYFAPEQVWDAVTSDRIVHKEYADGSVIAQTDDRVTYEPADDRDAIEFDASTDASQARQRAHLYATLDQKVGGLQEMDVGAIPTRITSMGDAAISAYRFAVHGEDPATIAGEMGMTQTEVVEALTDFAS